MDIFLQATVSGLAQGCVYALVVLGFVLIYKATEVPNFAQAEIRMVGAYVYFTLVTGLGLTPVWALAATLVVAALLGGLIERALMHPLADEPPFILIMVTIGTPLGLFAENAWQVSRRGLELIDTLFLYTDGLTEARNESDLFGEERLRSVLMTARNAAPRNVVQDVFRQAEEFCGSAFDDDVTVLAVRRKA